MAKKPKPNEMSVADPAAAFMAAVKAADVMDATPQARALARKLLSENKDTWHLAVKITGAALIGFIESMNATGLAKESYRLECERMKKELMVVEKDGALEKLLVDQVVLAWLRLSITEHQYTGDFGSESITFERGIYWERRLNAAQKRFSQATASLARVRGLLQSPRVKNLNLVAVNAVTASNANYGTANRAIANGRR